MTADGARGEADVSAGRTAGRRLRAFTALALGALAFAVVAIGQRDQGVVRDEVVYRAAGDRYAQWWIDLVTGADGALTERRITAHFGGPRATDNNREHPPLMKTLFGLSRALVHDELGWASPTTAYRLPSAAINALLVVLVFAFVCGIWGYAEAVIAALLALLLPRALFHAGLACMDAAITAMWFAALCAYHRALARRWWCVGAGIAFGLALATKHNAVLLPAVFFAHYAAVAWLRGRAAPATTGRVASDTGSGPRARPRAVAVVRRGLADALAAVRRSARAAVRGVRAAPPLALAGLALGPLVLVAVWPWLWFDTIDHVSAWLKFHLDHVHYNYEYLGANRNAPPYPWHVPVVTTLLTVPVATLAAAAIGAGFLAVWARQGQARDAARAPALLLLLSAGVAMGPFLLGTAPIFGAEKHWAPAIPTLCVYAGVGVAGAARLAVAAATRARPMSAPRTRRLSRLAVAGCGAAVVAAAAATHDAHPYALTHYNALAGGAPGGADLGMNRQFWGYAARGVLPVINRHAPPPGAPPVRVYTHDASPAWGIYRREGLLAPGLVDAGGEAGGIARSSLALVIHERHFNRHDYMIWSSYGTVQPVYVLTTDGVPIVSVYARPKTPAPGGDVGDDRDSRTD